MSVDQRAMNTVLGSLPAGLERETLLGLDGEARRPAITGWLLQLWREVDPGAPAALDPGKPMPLESLVAAALKATVEAALHVELPLLDLLEGVTLDHLAGLLLSEVERGGEAAPGLAFQVGSDRAARHDPFPLTDVQQAYWLGRNPVFELGDVGAMFYLELDFDDFDVERAEGALGRLIERHEMLRAVILPDGRQQIEETVPPLRIRARDLTGLAPEEADARSIAIRWRMSSAMTQPHRWPLVEVEATQLPGGRTRVHFSVDLLACDASSIVLLVREWLGLYEDPATRLHELELSFRDYVLALGEVEQSEAYRRAREYWLRRVPGLPARPDLPLARPPASLKGPRLASRTFRLDAATWERLRARASRVGLTPSMLLCAAYAEVLGTWSRSRRFTLNVPIQNRLPLHPQVGQIIGDFTSLNLLEVDGTAAGGFEARALALQRQMAADLEHRLFSGVRVMRELARAGGPTQAAMPVVFTSVIGQGAGSGELLPERAGRIVHTVSQVPQVYLENQVYEAGGGLQSNWDAVEELFPPGLLEEMFTAYRELLERLAGDESAWREEPSVPLPRAQAERRAAVNATAAAVSEGLLHTPIERQVEARPEATALVTAERRISYGELSRLANGVGWWLRERGVGPDELVAVVMEKGWEQVVAALGVLRSGAAYLPVDAELPRERIWHLLERGEVRLVVTQPGVEERVEWPEGVRCLVVDETMAGDERPLPPMQTPQNLAYVIFTSGSTGQPKGVMIEHRAALNTVLDINRRYRVEAGDAVLALSSLSFDLSVYDIFGLLGAGGRVVIPGPEDRHDPERWAELMEREGVTVWDTVPALMEMLVDGFEGRQAGWSEGLRLVMMSGDWVPVTLPERIRRLAPGARVVSLGGATEASIWSIAYPVERVEPGWRSVPYGRPLANQGFHVLDELGEACPELVPGELHISGVGLARGYWRDPERTAASFVSHPRTGERLYRTGDVGRYLRDGNIEFLGREDFQVKVNGYRIELGEIEAALEQHPQVRSAAVVAHGHPQGPRHLVAYVVPDRRVERAGAAHDHVLEWTSVYDQVYEAEAAEPTLNTAGWISSFTGEPIPPEQMREWAETTVERIRALRPRRVLEIGCGTGMLLTRLAGDCEAYMATDVSERAVRGLRELVGREGARYRGVRLVTAEAADFGPLESATFDTVVINSVVQYFPDAGYLVDVMEKAIAAVRPGGHVFVGDVRSLPLLDAFHGAVALHRASSGAAVADVLRAIDEAEAAENELVVDPRLFTRLAEVHPRITGVAVRPRGGRMPNEMTKFRYDVVLDVDGPVAPPASRLRTAVPNARVAREVRALELLRSAPADATIDALRAELGRSIEAGVDPDDEGYPAECLAPAIEVDWSAGRPDGSFDVVVRVGAAQASERQQGAAAPVDWSLYANEPLRAASTGNLGPELRRFLAGKLPAYEVPAVVLELDGLPLSANGKVDRSALPEPVAAAIRQGQEFVAPRDERERTLAEIWSELLGIEAVGALSSFFELGGDSLRAARLVARAAEAGLQLTVGQVFETPVLADLATAAGVAPAAGVPTGGARLPAMVPADLRNRFQPFPLMPIQQAYLLGRNAFFELGDASTSFYAEIDAPDLDLDRAQRALQRLIERHEMLRVVVLPDGRQRILPEVPDYEIEVTDLSGLSREAAEAELLDSRERLSRETRVSDRWPLFDVRAFRLPGGTARLCLAIDLLIIDGGSLRVFIEEWARLYDEPDAPLPALEVSFRDYVVALADIERSEAYRTAREYWLGRLSDLPRAPELPLLTPAGTTDRPRYCRRTVRLGPDTWRRLKARASWAGLTPSMLLCAAYAEVLGSWSRSRRFTFSVTIGDRLALHPRIHEIMGNFTSVNLLEVDGTAAGGFETRALALQRQMAADLEHRLFSGVRVMRELARAGGPTQAAMPVVFTSVIGQGAGSGELLPERAGRIVHTVSQVPQVYLENQVYEAGGGLQSNWDAVEELFPPGLLEEMFTAYRELLERLAGDESAWREEPSVPLPRAQAERRAAVNATAAAVSEGLLHTPIERQVEARPEATALVTAERRISYGELSRLANGVGWWLRERGVGPDELVAVVMEKGWEQVVAALGVLRSGAAYLPVDAELPRERIWHLLERGEVRLVVTQPGVEERVEWPEGVRCLVVDETMAGDERPLPPMQTPQNLAYVIFTSGSTGQPKGVMIEHRAALNTVLDINRRYRVEAGDAVLALSSLSFDLSVYDIFGLLGAGGRVVIPGPEDRHDPERWAELMEREGVTVWDTVPALMEMLVDGFEGRQAGWSEGLRLVMMSGDWVPVTLPERIRRLAPGARVVSLGGATEASIWSIAYPVERVEPGWRSVPYGRPLANQGFHVLDELGEACPELVPGELHISGVGLARGYWRDPERTAASFVSHPRTGERLYRTGDVGRYLRDGNIEFLGREDFQVKVNGYRIELGEIEAALEQHPQVRSAAVVAHGHPQGPRHLVAYVVPSADRPPDAHRLADFLAAKLPDYMVPASWQAVEKLPLTSNGKVDRSALAALHDPPPASGIAFQAPRNELEQRLADVWSQHLDADRISVFAHFAELGGDSLVALQIIADAGRAGIHVAPALFFEHPTIAELAEALTRAPVREIDQSPVVGPVPLMPIQRWFLEQDVRERHHWNYVFLFEVPEAMERTPLELALREMLEHHDALRLRFTQDGAGWTQTCADPPAAEPLPLAWVELGHQGPDERRRAVEERSRSLQGSLDLAHGPLLRLAYFSMGAGEPDRLLIVGHWLVWDVYSCHVFFEDLLHAYEEAARTGRCALPRRTTSLRSWSEQLGDAVRAGGLAGDVEYWLGHRWSAVERLPVDLPGGDNTLASARTVIRYLDPAVTRRLLAAPSALRVSINDILLTALGRAVTCWSGAGSLLVDLEGHGREDLGPATTDLSRTIGRVSTLFPVLTEIDGDEGHLDGLHSVSRQLKALPRGGLAYGALRYLSQDAELVARLESIRPDVGFNYLGRLEDLYFGRGLSPASESPGAYHSTKGHRSRLIDVLAGVAGGSFVVGLTYSANLHREATAAGLADAFLREVTALVDHNRPPRDAVRPPETGQGLARLLAAWVSGLAGGAQ